ncbi:mandelate racemase/muconate lactonizing enzyme family protein [Phycisphaerales bacterium AB-hyl4]|uniref:Mandelate racemase/muconate lactonizing enzyme family protein n=1 Tax=Natronomicrosphaera hydrolytica TaxID=3242702 RepID=A0ABV4U383_9BACT
MKIESVDLYYLAMPAIKNIGDGSQDALLVRIAAGQWVGWGECETSPLVSMANWACPMSHSACRPVRDGVLGQRLETPADIARINAEVRKLGLDIAQTDHTLSGIDIALWDLLGKRRGEPVYRLLGDKQAYPKTPYASQLFGDDPQQTLAKARTMRDAGYAAVKFGWGPFGQGSVDADREQVAAAREGLGSELMLLVDAGTVWDEDVSAAAARLSMLDAFEVTWLEEPFVSGALAAYRELTARGSRVQMAAGEGAHNFHMARHLIDHGGIGYVQIDTGRIGGITPARRVAEYANAHDVTYVNHTFTTHLALSASLQPYAGMADHTLCEYPVEASDLATRLTKDQLRLDADGQIRVPESPGLGVDPDPAVIDQYHVDVEMYVAGRCVFRSGAIAGSNTDTAGEVARGGDMAD